MSHAAFKDHNGVHLRDSEPVRCLLDSDKSRNAFLGHAL
jgi:hypothetical protein